MLVLTRKENQSVVFPRLGISVEINRVAGKTVRVGIEAPDSVRILRGELASDAGDHSDHSGACSESETLHELRNRLNKASLALNLISKQLAAGRIEDAEKSLGLALDALSDLEDARGLRAVVQDVVESFHANASDSPTPVRKRALLVEDDPNERVLLASYLRASGYEVDTAEDGQAALEYLACQKPDAIVMDMEMPRLGGEEAVSEIRANDTLDDVKLYIVSGTEPQRMRGRDGSHGIQRWFQKPLHPEDLVNEFVASLN